MEYTGVKDKYRTTATQSLFNTVIRDIHFWIPLLVLLAGLLLLHELR